METAPAPSPTRADSDAPRKETTAPRITRLSDTALAYVMNAPALVVICAIVAYPIAYSFWLSLHRYNLKDPTGNAFIGLQNYFSLLNDGDFLNSLKVSFEFAAVVLAIIFVLGLALALLLNETFLGRGVLRSLVLLPWAMPGVVNGLMWRWIFDPKVGVLNGLLSSLGLIDDYYGWLIHPTSAFFLTAVAEAWNLLPIAVIILLSGLSTIPTDLYDAARVDRAGVVNRFRHVTLPWLLHPLLLALILETMNAFRAFDTIYVLTGGGPGDATNVIALLTVRTTLTYLQFGSGDAYAYVITLITLVIAIGYVAVLYGRGNFER